ncbi:MAG: hypothetical protein EXR95_08385 [Gemmatimonadetes bacterium]|nr:hypothetical protein [Gemmatimonadota bacterium]
MRATTRALALGAALALASPAYAQQLVRELELNGGLSVEAYRGNLAAATAAVPDSTDRADAAVGEIGVRGMVALHESERRWAFLGFDGGFRQFAAGGFVVRDYAPREWVGQGALSYSQLLGDWGSATTRLGWRGRSVKDRPPMPLFLQPGFGIATASLKLELNEIDQVRLDVQTDAEWADYSAQRFARQLDLLDRRSQGVEVGAAWGERAMVRVFGALRQSRYPNQATFDTKDPVRRDHTIQAGFSWTIDAPVTAEVGIEGTVNRSNSRRPEYDAVSLRSLVSVPLPFDIGATVLAVVTGKSYVNQSDFKVLVPGEEADNASVVYLDLARPVALGLDASLRLGWTRAEADVNDAYFQRFGVSMLLRYRPGGF